MKIACYIEIKWRDTLNGAFSLVLCKLAASPKKDIFYHQKKSHASIMLPALSFPVARIAVEAAVRKSYNQGGQQGDLVFLK